MPILEKETTRDRDSQVWNHFFFTSFVILAGRCRCPRSWCWQSGFQHRGQRQRHLHWLAARGENDTRIFKYCACVQIWDTLSSISILFNFIILHYISKANTVLLLHHISRTALVTSYFSGYILFLSWIFLINWRFKCFFAGLEKSLLTYSLS